MPVEGDPGRADSVQSAGKLPRRIAAPPTDLSTFSGHKIAMGLSPREAQGSRLRRISSARGPAS